MESNNSEADKAKTTDVAMEEEVKEETINTKVNQEKKV